MFGTKFEVMDQAVNQQTTEGIWLSINKDKNVFVMDVEGTDSSERNSNGEKHTYEQSTSTFALAMSDVFMINLDCDSIGQYEGCNYDIIEIIFQMNLALFEQKQLKRLLFVVRDFNKDEQNEEAISTRLQKDLEGLWQKTVCDTEHASKILNDFFHVDYVFLAHKLFEEAEFMEGALQLAQRFKLDTPNSLFLTKDEKENVPVSAYSKYMEQTWQAIRENK